LSQQLEHLTGGSVPLAQWLAIIAAVVASILIGHVVRQAWQRRPPPRRLWQALTGTVDLALHLAWILALVRAGVFAFSQLLGPHSWLQSWELQVTSIVWLSITFQQIGWLSHIEETLDSIDLLPGKAQFSLWSLLKSLVVITGFVLVGSLIARAIEQRVMKLRNVAMSTRVGIAKFSHFFLVGLGALVGVNAAGVDLTALTLITGAVGIGLGFGLQAIASNFVSGFVLLLDKSIKPGDVISFTGLTGTSTENFGWVQELRGRCVVVRDRDGVETLVPNQNLITNAVINWSYSDRKVRLKLPVRISYRDDPELALASCWPASRGQSARAAGSRPRSAPDAVQRPRHGPRAALLDRRSAERPQQRAL
jgi:small-conductance mechanosensitive channel